MKIRLITVFLIVIIGSVFAQDSKVLVGVKASPTYIDCYHVFTNKHRFSFSTGVTFDYNISQKFSLKSALTFDIKGFATEVSARTVDSPEGISEKVLYKSNYEYLMVPLLVSYSRSTEHSFYLDAGFFVGYLLKQETSSKDISYSSISLRKKIDFGLTLGFGWDIPISEKVLVDIGLTENLGLLNIYTHSEGFSGVMKTNSVELKLGLKIRI